MWSVLFFVLAICFFAKHIQNPVMSMEKPNPTVYCISTTLTQAKPIGQPMTKISIRGRKVTGENPKDAADLNEYPLFSKYNSGFTATPAPKKILQHQL
jgi:hypothetical protein